MVRPPTASPPSATRSPAASRGARRPASFLAARHPLFPRTVETSDGTLSFAVRPTRGAISVERIQVHEATCVRQVMRFEDEASFTRWCEADPLKEAAVRMGADVAAWCIFVREAPERATYWFFLACDPHWCIEYESCGGYAHDPWLAYARTHSEPLVASGILAYGDRQAEVVRVAERFGFRSTVVVPVPAGKGMTRVRHALRRVARSRLLRVRGLRGLQGPRTQPRDGAPGVVAAHHARGTDPGVVSHRT